AFIVIPILAPVADKMLGPLLPEGTPPNMTLVWFGVMVAMNLQTSFLTPPFGFALFYLRSVAAKTDYLDRITGAKIAAVTTPQIYRGSIAFIFLQLIMVGLVIAYPNLVVGGIDKGPKIDVDKALMQLENRSRDRIGGVPAEGAPPASAPAAQDDPMRMLLESMQRDAEKKR
ncbi:MAG: TRAP transporter large permease subunit, partial [Rubrivivax sp.]